MAGKIPTGSPLGHWSPNPTLLKGLNHHEASKNQCQFAFWTNMNYAPWLFFTTELITTQCRLLPKLAELGVGCHVCFCRGAQTFNPMKRINQTSELLDASSCRSLQAPFALSPTWLHSPRTPVRRHHQICPDAPWNEQSESHLPCKARNSHACNLGWIEDEASV